jgi:GT2 family glycosyltransferase
MFVPRAQFDQVGGFRTGVAEDIEWSFRARAQGFKLGYAGGAVIAHPARHDWKGLERRWSRFMSEHYELALEQPFGRPGFALKALVMPLSIVPHMVRILTSKRLNSMRSRLGAIATLTRLRVWRARRMLQLVLGPQPLASRDAV